MTLIKMLFLLLLGDNLKIVIYWGGINLWWGESLLRGEECFQVGGIFNWYDGTTPIPSKEMCQCKCVHRSMNM